ncbi:MAG: ribosome-associated translation inhibitor RaiA [Spirochaetales bacterium]|nr:ribosome-associated translation inhibitor RaiA [Spirochaetales bacterium]
MNTEIKGVHVEITDTIRDYVDKKMHRLDFVREHLVDLLFSFSQEKSQFKLEANLNFRWGNSTHVGVASFDIFEGIDKLFDKMELKVIKEKKKIQDHKGQDSVRWTEVPLEEEAPSGEA